MSSPLYSLLRLTTIIAIILLIGCSEQHYQDVKNASKDSVMSANETQSEYVLIKENKCEQTNLSHQFDIEIDFKRYRYRDTTYWDEPCILKVFIKEKVTKLLIDTFSITSDQYYSHMFLSCDSMTSYSTGFKADREIPDYYYGDLVVADMNFDGYDDIAVINDIGGNGGPFYTYYIQTDKKKFYKDNYLTDTVGHFPEIFNSKRKTLTVTTHADASHYSETIYKLNTKKNTWREISYRRVRAGAGE